MHDVLHVADAILKIAKERGRTLTPMQLVKLCYIAHGWSLALRDRPLFPNRIEAWQYGPVIPDLYQVTKVYGRQPIPLDAIGSEENITLDAQDADFLREVFERYGHFEGMQLSWITHKPGSPWQQVSRGQTPTPAMHLQIPDSMIQQYYRMLKRNAQTAIAQ